jgi:hypothetical protein
VVGKLRRRKPPTTTEVPEVLTPEMLLKVVEKVVERHFGRGMYERLLQYVRTRCEEDGCGNDFEYICAYCGMRICNEHVIDCYGVVYCRLHADPEHRLADVFIVMRR